MMTAEYYMREAIKKARESIEMSEYPFGCCIVTDDNVMVSTGNTCFTERDPTRHAEINAIRELCTTLGATTLENAAIYTTAEPCTMCMGAIGWARIPHLTFGISLHESQKFGFAEVTLNSVDIASHFPYPITIEGGLLSYECLSLLDEWKKKNRVLSWFNNRQKKR